MSTSNLSETVTAALSQLKMLQESSPTSAAREEELPTLNGELRKLGKLLSDKINALPWNQERKQLLALRAKLDLALSTWDYEVEVDTSTKRLKELEKELSSSALNDSRRRKIQRERRTILALRRSLQQSGAATKSNSSATKSSAQKISEYKEDLRRAFAMSK